MHGMLSLGVLVSVLALIAAVSLYVTVRVFRGSS
jgi:hypothetical protein